MISYFFSSFFLNFNKSQERFSLFCILIEGLLFKKHEVEILEYRVTKPKSFLNFNIINRKNEIKNFRYCCTFAYNSF